MWKPLSIVSGLLLLAAGGIMYTQVQPNFRSEIKQLAEAKNNKTSADLNKRASDTAHANSEKDLAESRVLLAKNTGLKNVAQGEKDKKQMEVTEETARKDAAAKELADLEQKLKDLGGLPRLVAELKVLEAKQAQLTLEVANTKGAIESTIAHKEATDKIIGGLKQLDLWQKTGTMTPGFRTRVASVNPEQGFVILAAGNASKVTLKAKFDVRRGDTTIAKLIVTSIEQSSAVCEIIPGSLAPGDQVLPGDLVVVNDASTPRSLTISTPPAGPAKPGAKKPATDPTAAPANAPANAPADPFATPPAPDATAPAVPAAPMEEKKPAEAPAPEPAPKP